MKCSIVKKISTIATGMIGISLATATASLPKPVITNMGIDGTHLAVYVSSASNATLTLETKNQLSSNDWHSITTRYATDPNSILNDYPFVEKTAAFYQVRIDQPGTTTNMLYHGWSNVVQISNGIVSTTIVPETGRIMQFNFLGTNGVFWENRSLDGQSPDPDSSTWRNFGGDKSWPAPQADWSAITGRGWPPPGGFDSMANSVSQLGAEVVLQSPVDPSYGIQVTRRIRLFPGEPSMRVTTTYEQISDSTNHVGIWIITQLKDPERLFLPVAENSIFPDGYHVMSAQTPSDLVISNGLISFSRNLQTQYKIGSDCETMLWIGSNGSLEISAPRLPGVTYPDSNSSVEIYTGTGTDGYVELEQLGPLTQLLPGESISFGVNYTLHHRVLADPQLEAERILGKKP